MKTKFISLSLLGVLVYSCSPKITPQLTEVKKEITPKIEEGKSIYENNCAKCHKLYDPKSYSIQDWQPILKRMQSKARLQDADMDKINAYLSNN